ncbi:L-serine ammonia-lyase [Acidocella aromatica]|uniref:L-serine dehydratase n=1 Tax=Acidocella aromatica TaxID=1303579 RepID=A0A840VSK6_9PROT|nr:L-serine ammonia-lyase [Acidocella aromatica]MBB5374300.1 L-serine dehydratase [Acidocella aromatica]
MQPEIRHTASASSISLLDLFRIGIGPSSSHTVGPMRAANAFLRALAGREGEIARLTATAYGSLAWTGKGHATDKAMVLGLAGCRPDEILPDEADKLFHGIGTAHVLRLPDGREIGFDPVRDVSFDRQMQFKRHTNAMRFTAFDTAGREVLSQLWFSIGGGFVVRDGEESEPAAEISVPYPYGTAAQLLHAAQVAGLSIAELALANEGARHQNEEVLGYIGRVAEAMFACIERGLTQQGELSGGLHVKRRARHIYAGLQGRAQRNEFIPHTHLDYVCAFAMAVNEENAAGGRVVTAPTNGAAGVIPAVLRYYRDFCDTADEAGVRTFFLTAAAVGGLIKRNASISGAEVGCQGEVGSASAMAAAGLCAALGGSNAQVENAAEIAMEHHLGMTCDPIGGLVQVPCIERNAFGAIKAITAASLALQGDGTHIVSLDAVIETMRQTGFDMQSKYKETSLGGLAANVTIC